jgi:uroporphyrinogen decarboxylase
MARRPSPKTVPPLRTPPAAGPRPPGPPATSDCDWLRRCLAHEETDAVPYNFMFSPPTERLAKQHYGPDLAAGLALPMRMTAPRSIKPLYASPDRFGPTVSDEFGVVWSTSRIDRGAPLIPCLPEPDLSHYHFPQPDAAARFADIGDWSVRQQGHFRIIWVGDLWERATFMRGMEAILLDVAAQPAFVARLLEQLTEYILGTLRILIASTEFEGIAVSDDYGTQNGLVMSPAHWRQLVRPCLARIYAMAKQHGLIVFHHSCGNILPIIGDLLDLGLDILHPIQPEAMDVLRLKKEFGRHLTLCGGVPTQTLLVSGTPGEVRREVRRLQREMGRGGGYILEPGITLQADVPEANLIALIEAARRPQ